MLSLNILKKRELNVFGFASQRQFSLLKDKRQKAS